MKRVQNCITCGKGLLQQGSTTFPCPMCDTPIGRCSSCREQSVTYKCGSCGFTGP